jgi:N-acetylneuraminate synthase
MSANHLGSKQRAFDIIKAAKDAGCDAVKLQSYRADTITIDAHGPGFDLTEGPWAGRTLYELYRDAAMPWEWHAELFEFGAALGIPIFSAPFDLTAVGLLKSLDAPAYKIASFEITDHELIASCAQTGKPLIISTGLSSMQDVAEAVEVAKAHGCASPILLHCVSAYPTPYSDANLQRITALQNSFPSCVIGLSDHSHGAVLAGAAVALGARVIEKHLTLARTDGGPDSFFSLEPDEMAVVVSTAKAAWEATRVLRDGPSSGEKETAGCRRSLYVVADIKVGEEFSRENVRSIRPGHGLAPKYLSNILGRKAIRDIARGSPLSWDMVEGEMKEVASAFRGGA